MLLTDTASSLAGSSRPPVAAGRRLLPAQFQESARALERIHRLLGRGVAQGRELTAIGAWLWENRRLIREHVGILRQELTRSYSRRLLQCGAACNGFPRVYELASALVRSLTSPLDEEGLNEFVASYQKEQPLRLAELAAVPNMLRLALLERLRQVADESLERGALFCVPPRRNCSGNETPVRTFLESLRSLELFDWKTFLEDQSFVEQILRCDPAGAYRQMAFESRDHYRHAVERLARRSLLGEEQVARAAIRCAADHELSSHQRHVGHWLVGRGRPALEESIGYRPALGDSVARLASRAPLAWYLAAIAGVWLATTATAIAAAVRLPEIGALGIATKLLMSVCFAGAAAQFALSLVNWLATLIVPPRKTMRMDFSDGIPAEYRTLVVVPTMLTGERAIRSLVEQLELRYLANPDDHLLFALLTDFPDADHRTLPGDGGLMELARRGIERLNQRYVDGSPSRFFLLHRPRKWNPSEGVWMGEERKRGKLGALNRLIRTGAAQAFSATEGELDELTSVRYVITLDTDTQLPPGAARRLVGCLAHPLNRPRIDPAMRHVVEGHGILQPRIGTPIREARCSPFTRLFCAEAGIDPYTRETSDVYQDLFDEGSFIGKGIYDVEAFETSLAGRFPKNRVLSHDLIEGCFARSGFVSDVELFEGYPSRLLTDTSRRHRWIRGDWQIAAWLFRKTPAEHGREPNPIGGLGRWKIFDNLRRSVTPLFLAAFLVFGWVLAPQSVAVWTLAALALVLAPGLITSLACLLRKPSGKPVRLHLRHHATDCLSVVGRELLPLMILPYTVHVHLDAMVRTLYRLHRSRRRLLQWSTASETEARFTGTLRDHCEMMRVSTFTGLGLAAVLVVLDIRALAGAAPLLAAWTFAPWVAWWISRPYERSPVLTAAEERPIRRWARQTWHYFDSWMTDLDHGLPPDNVQEGAAWSVAHRTSPTNLGLGLLADLAACDLGYLPPEAFLRRTGRTLRAMGRLERYRGHFYNWYDTRTLQPLEPRYVSSVDSGNLWGALSVLEHGLQELPDHPLVAPRGLEGLRDAIEAVEAIREATGDPPGWGEFDAGLAALRRVVSGTVPKGARATHALVRRFRALAETLPAHIPASHPALGRWAEAMIQQAAAAEQCLARLAFWTSCPVTAVHLGTATPPADWQTRDESRRSPEEWVEELRSYLDSLDVACTIRELPEVARRVIQRVNHFEATFVNLDAEDASPYQDWRQAVSTAEAPSQQRVAAREGRLWAQLAALRAAADRAAEAASRQLQEVGELCSLCRAFSVPDFRFLFHPRRKLLRIGFDVSQRRPDENCYGFLASEARLASFMAVSHGQIPAEHWFTMGRSVTLTDGQPTLLSWSGSMFEYLMPMLLMPSCPDTVLDATCIGAVRRQIRFGRRHGIPWGISESCCHAFDGNQAYRYRGLGVPGLGMADDLAADRVVAPYATALATMVAPREAVANLARLERLGYLSPYGFYDAIDYTPGRCPSPGEPCRAVMAHHSAMSLLAFAHVLLDGPMPRRFLENARLRAHQILLEERVPKAIRPVDPLKLDLTPSSQQVSPPAILRR
jgi:hypothetical protein